MSEIQKPVVVEEQQPVCRQRDSLYMRTRADLLTQSVTETATPAPVVAESTQAPAVAEATPAPVTSTESTPAAPAVQEDLKPVVEETKPEVTKEEFNGEGVLGYKAPGGFLK